MASPTKAELIEHNAQLEAENSYLRKARIADGIIQVALAAVRYGALIVVGYWGLEAIRALAGSSTFADISVDFLTEINVSVALAWSVGVFGGVYGYKQRHLRRNTVERLQGRIRELEAMIDPQRSSSKLTTRGDTRPEDRI